MTELYTTREEAIQHGALRTNIDRWYFGERRRFVVSADRGWKTAGAAGVRCDPQRVVHSNGAFFMPQSVEIFADPFEYKATRTTIWVVGSGMFSVWRGVHMPRWYNLTTPPPKPEPLWWADRFDVSMFGSSDDDVVFPPLWRAHVPTPTSGVWWSEKLCGFIVECAGLFKHAKIEGNAIVATKEYKSPPHQVVKLRLEYKDEVRDAATTDLDRLRLGSGYE